MATRYLPVELQDVDGNVIHPQTDADLVWMKDGKSAEESIKEKTKVVISDINIPIDQRKEGEIYLFKNGAGTVINDSAVAMASPSVGYRMVR